MRTAHSMRVLVVAKMHMQKYACAGGMSLDLDKLSIEVHGCWRRVLPFLIARPTRLFGSNLLRR